MKQTSYKLEHLPEVLQQVSRQRRRSFALHASVPMLLPVPGEASGALRVYGWSVLYQVLDKAAATARTLPNRVAQKFHQATAILPKSTEAERWVVQRVGQNLFRSALLDYWQGRCCVTGLAVPELLRASHIRPWALCDTDEQRLDVFNGLLLSPNLDALFDGGWVTFMPTGAIAFAVTLPQSARESCRLPYVHPAPKRWATNGDSPVSRSS